MTKQSAENAPAEQQQAALLIAFHFPPIQGSSGVFRSIGFSRYLPQFGWKLSVLTVGASAYESRDEKNKSLIPDGVTVTRAPAFNSRKQLSFRGRYLRFLALPDAWQSWLLTGFFAGLWRIWRDKSEAVISTYPIATAHLLGYWLSRASRRPWVADFRDPMVQGQYPPDRTTKSVFQYIERRVFEHARHVIVVSPGAKRFYLERYPSFPEENLHVIPNGYDESAFDGLPGKREAEGKNKIRILHSGIMYARERNPEKLFDAIATLDRRGDLTETDVEFTFRAANLGASVESALEALKIENYIRFEPSVDYRSALAELYTVDALLVCQGAVCNDQIPAKLYEYLFTRQPIIGLCDPAGDTGQLLLNLGCPYVAPLEDADAISACLKKFLHDAEQSRVWRPTEDQVREFSRKASAESLGQVLDALTARP